MRRIRVTDGRRECTSAAVLYRKAGAVRRRSYPEPASKLPAEVALIRAAYLVRDGGEVALQLRSRALARSSRVSTTKRLGGIFIAVRKARVK